MATGRFRGWFSDVGFTCRVLIICDMLDQWAETWGAEAASPMREAIQEVQETALLEMDRWMEAGKASGYFEDPFGLGQPEASPPESDKPDDMPSS